MAGVKEQDFLIRRFQTVSPNLVTNSKLNIFQVTKSYLVEKIYNSHNISSDVLEFSHEMDLLYDWSDIVISRAGSMTLSEICKAGRAAILVPFHMLQIDTNI